MRPKKPKKDMQPEKPAKDNKLQKLKEDDKSYQSRKNVKSKDDRLLCSDKNCQEIKRPRKPRSNMQSVTKETDMQLPKPARLYSDKNCQSTRCYSLKKKCPVRPV